MNPLKLAIDTDGIETVLDSSEVHWRIIFSKRDNAAVPVCVQDFDYIDYAEFIGEVNFAREVDAQDAAELMNHVGVEHFSTVRTS